MADFWNRYGIKNTEDEEKDRKKNNLSFWARYGQQAEETPAQTTMNEPEPDSFLGKLAQRGVTIELPEPEKKEEEKPAGGLSLLGGSDQAKKASTDLFAQKLGKTFTAQQTDNTNRKIAAEDITDADRKEYKESLSKYRTQEEIQKDLDAANQELSDARKKWWRDEFLAWGGGIEGRTKTLEENDARNAEIKSRIADLEAEQRQRENAEKYEAIRYQPDFTEKAKAPELTTKDALADPLYAYINGDKTAGMLLMDLNDTVHGKETLVAEQMTPDEVKIYNYIHATEGKDAADAYVEFLRPELNERNMESVKDQVANLTDQNIGTKILGSAASVAMAPLRGLAYAGQALDYLTTGKVDPNAPYNMYSAIPSAARETVSNDIQRKWGKWGTFAYQTGLSMADFLLTAGVSGGSEALSLSIMGTGAAADATISAKERGLGDTESFIIGTIAGAAEIASEKISFEKLFKNADLRYEPVKYILQNTAFEGLEEVESDIVNWLADAIVARHKSEWQADMDAYKAEHPKATDTEAFWDAVKQRAIEGGMDFLGGAISGGIMAGGAVTLTGAATGAQRRTDRSQNIEAVRAARNAQEAAQTRGTPEGAITLPTASDEMGAADASRGASEIRMGTEPAPGLKTADEVDLENKVAKAKNNTEATGIKYGADKADIRAAEKYSRMTGMDVEFYSEGSKNGTAQNGYYDPSTNKIYYNVNAKEKFRFTFGHEFTHGLEGTRAYNALSDLVKTRIDEAGEDLDMMRAQIQDRYDRAGIKLTAEQVDQEIVADWIGNNLSDERTMREICRENASVGKQIRDALDSFITRAADMQGIVTPYEVEKYQNIVKAYDRYLERAEEAEAMQPAEPTQPSEPVQPVQTAKDRSREWLGNMAEKWKGIKKGDIAKASDEIFRLGKETFERNADGTYNITSGKAEQVFAQAQKLARELVKDANTKEDNELFHQYAEPRKYLRETPIHYDRATLVAERGGEEDFKEWRAKQRGILNLTSKEGEGLPIDTIFDEFAEKYPGLLNLTAVQDTDRLDELAKVAQYMREQERSNNVNPYEQDLQTAWEELGTEIYQEMANRLYQSSKPKQAKPKQQPARAKTTAKDAASVEVETVPTGPETAEDYLARMGRLYDAGEITEEQYQDAQAIAAEMESTGRGFESSTVERDEGPEGKIPAFLRNVRDRVAGRQYSISEGEYKENAQKVLDYFGKTYSWKETGYVTRDGDRIDLSGKREGGPAGHRSLDHRDIADALGSEYGGEDYSGAMVQFMREGNIRITPETGGINLQIEPTEKQYERLKDFIQMNRGEVMLDIDDENGSTVESREYPSGTRSNKVLGDIRYYFENGELPEEVRYSVSEVNDTYMQAVEDDDMETAQRLVDETAERAGYTRRMWHGAKNGKTFTTFKGWSYFTEDRTYAEKYSNRDPENLYGVYAKVERPFDTRIDPDAREDFETARQEYGMSMLNDSGLPDWTDGYDIVDYIEENGLNYDAVVLDEGVQYNLDAKTYDDRYRRVESYVIRDSAQIKSADPVTYDDDGNVIPLTERFQPEQVDIRYSVSEAEANTTEIAEKDPNSYPYDTRKVIKGYIDAVDADVLDYVNRINGNEKTPSMIKLGTVSEKLGAAVEAAVGINPVNGDNRLTADTVRHIERRHGTKGEQDHSMQHPEDIARIQYVLDNFDSVKSTERVTKADRNKDGTYSRTVEISKKIDGTYYIIEAVPDAKNNRMTVISAYIKNNRNTVGADAEAPGGTSETYATPVPATESRDTGSSAEAARNRQENSVNDIVSQPEEEVKGVEQKISSWKTSIKQIPALFTNKNVEFGDTNVDIGGGRFDLATDYLRDQGTENFIFDPFNRTDEENRRALDVVMNGGADTATCANVLNVIAEEGARANVILETSKAIKPDGTAYFMVYEGDGSGNGRETSSGWQENRKTADYMDEIGRYFDDVTRKGKLIIARSPKANLPMAVWETSPGNAVRYSVSDNEPMTLNGLTQKAQSYALRAENTLATAVAQALGVETNRTRDAYKTFRAEIVRPVIEAMLRGEDVYADQFLADAGLSLTEAAAVRSDVEEALKRARGEIGRVRRSVNERAAEQEARERRNAEIDAQIPDDAEGRIKMANAFKDAKKRWTNARARTLMTDKDIETAHLLALGQISEEEARARSPYGYQDVIGMAEAERDYIRTQAPWERYKKRLAERQYEMADRDLENADRAKDKASGFQYARETPERNFRDVFGSDAGRLIDDFIRPIHKSEALSTRFKNKYIKRVKHLGLSQKVARGNQNSEAAAVQFLGEAEDNVRYLEAMRRPDAVRDGQTLDEWRSAIEQFKAANPNLDYTKVHNAIDEFQKIYGELIDQMNTVLVDNGYMPVNIRRGYFPHFNGGSDGILSTFAHLLGINIESNALPTAINGLTSGFKPGKAWFGHAQERTGFRTDYDAIQGFDGYIGGVSDVIHQTSNIRNLRALSTRIRYMFGDEGIRQQINRIEANDTLTETEKEVQIQDLKDRGQYKLSRFVAWLDEYTNLLANKKSKYDRGVEDLMGRRFYTWMKNIEGRVAANMISGNLGSALTNFIPLNQAGAMLGDYSMLRGAFDKMTGRARDDGFVNRSDFLTNRRGTDPLIQSKADKISEFLSSPMNRIDNFTSEVIVRAAYDKYVHQGMDPQSAMQEADEFAAGVMADRSKGATPTIFSSHNPLTKLLTQFQVEVNNEFSTIFKDIPKGVHIPDKEKKNMAAVAAWTMLRYFIGAYLFNDLYEKLVGRRAALDPIDILNDAVGDLTGAKLNNTFDMLTEGVIEREQPKNPSDALTELGKNALEELPFIGGLMGGGRIPISSALPDAETIVKGLSNENWSGSKKAQAVGRELGKTVGTYILPPFAGGLGKKIYQTAENTIKGGRFVKNAEGEDQLQYPYFTDTPLETAGTIAQSAFFGPTATEGGRDWVEGGFGNQSAKVTTMYRRLTDEIGESQRDAWNLIQTINDGEYGRDTMAKRYAIAQSNLSEEGKALAMETYMSESEGRKFRGASEFGVTAGEWAALYSAMDEYDVNDNNTYSQKEIVNALDNITVPLNASEGMTQGLFGGSTDERYLTNREKAILWAAYGYKQNGNSWKQSNNPYDPEVGERVIDWINGLDYGEEEDAG